MIVLFMMTVLIASMRYSIRKMSVQSNSCMFEFDKRQTISSPFQCLCTRYNL